MNQRWAPRKPVIPVIILFQRTWYTTLVDGGDQGETQRAGREGGRERERVGALAIEFLSFDMAD